ncbi:MAG: hypothetical protein ABI777_08985 [Betaproteobacteria bacterium]
MGRQRERPQPGVTMAFMERAAQDRVRIAQTAARYIAEHGVADWSLAKRKAVRELGLPAREALPGDEEIEAALLEYHTLFGGVAHAARLREQRTHALRWMHNLKAFAPELVGGVAAGWATAHSDIRLDLVAPDAKDVEFALLNANIAYRTMHGDRDGAAELYIDTPVAGVRLSIRSAAAARQRQQRDRNGQEPVRLDAAALMALLAD